MGTTIQHVNDAPHLWLRVNFTRADFLRLQHLGTSEKGKILAWIGLIRKEMWFQYGGIYSCSNLIFSINSDVEEKSNSSFFTTSKTSTYSIDIRKSVLSVAANALNCTNNKRRRILSIFLTLRVKIYRCTATRINATAAYLIFIMNTIDKNTLKTITLLSCFTHKLI